MKWIVLLGGIGCAATAAAAGPRACPRTAPKPDLLKMPFHKPLHREPESCGTIADVRPKLPATRDQASRIYPDSGSNWCFAFAAADLLTAKLGQDISPIDLAIIYQRKSEREAHRKNAADPCRNDRYPLADANSGGTIEDAVIAVREKGGACRHEDLPATKDFATLIKLLGKQKLGKSPADSTCIDGALAMLAPNANLGNLQRVFRSEAAWRLYEGIDREACKTRIAMPRVRVKTLFADDTSSSERLKTIDRVLESGQPVGFESYFNFDYPGWDIDRLNGNRGHSTTLVGRRWNERTGTCQYLLRNSWGARCQPYGNDEDPSPYECDADGNIWISESTLMSVAPDVSYLY